MDTRTSIVSLVLAAFLGLVPATIAKRKGWSFVGWWCYGFLIWIVAIPHALLLKRHRKALAPLGPQTKRDSTSAGE
jgi:hypothetical protein